MNHQKLLTIFRRVLSCPTAPFHEYHVRAELEELLQGCANVSLATDPYGSLMARYCGGEGKASWVFGAHMDHPGFVRDPGTGDWQFLGGVPASFLALGAPKREFGSFAMWDLPEFAVEEELIVSRVCDDLVGCAVMVCMIHELERLGVRTPVDVVFTRAEEVGFLGAIELGRAWPFEPEAVFVSLETSSPVPGVRMGGGPVIRAGDAASFFDDAASAVILDTAKTAGIPVQRALLDRGSCEATAMQHYGIRSAGISVLLANYHNCSPDGKIAAEAVNLGDVKQMVRLLVALVMEGRTRTATWEVVEIRFEERRQRYEHFRRGAEDHFA